MIILENQLLNDKMFSIPEKLTDHLKLILNNHLNDKESRGYKRLNSLVNSSYNDRSNKQDKGKKYISYSDLKRINHDFDNMTHTKDNKEFILNGGQEMCNWVKQTLQNSRDSVEPQLKKLKQDTIRNNKLKADKNPTRPSSIRRMLDSLNESVEEHRYYDFILEYDERYVFNAIINGDNLWSPLINPMMYEKALNEFVKFGYLEKFPSKYIYQWIGIIMKNTAILRACTEIAGHSMCYPIDVLIEIFFDDDEEKFNEYKEKNDLEDDDDAYDKFCDENGIYNALSMPDGSDAWSDFGIDPIEKLIFEYNEGLSAEQVLVLINKILDVTHQRGDLASIFIDGGSKTLTKISYNESKIYRKVYITENQMNELRQQLELPFDGDDEKMIYQHFIDYLEDIGYYGQLSSSPISFEQLLRRTLNNTNEIVTLCMKDLTLMRNVVEDMIGDISSTAEMSEMLDIDDNFERDNLAEEILVNYDADVFIENMNELGVECVKEYITNYIEHMLDYHDFNVKSDEGNLVKIERVIQIPNLTSKQGDFYQELIQRFKGIGNYWSFVQGEAFWSQYTGDCITIEALVDPRQIDMNRTIYCALYDLHEEHEIYIPNGEVEIVSITTDDGKRLPLHKPIIVKV